MKALIEKYESLAKTGNGTIRTVIGVAVLGVFFFSMMWIGCAMDAGIF